MLNFVRAVFMTFFRIPCFMSCLKYYDFKTSSCTLSSFISCIIIPFTRSLANALTLRDFWGESIVFWFDCSSISSYSTALLTLFASEPPPRTFYIRISSSSSYKGVTLLFSTWPYLISSIVTLWLGFTIFRTFPFFSILFTAFATWIDLAFSDWCLI